MSTIQNISLYIPHIFENYTRDDVAAVFEDSLIGRVKGVDFVSKMGKNGKAYNSAYIHFHHWYNNTAAGRFQERVQDPNKEARIVYDDPWYWIVLENNTEKQIPGARKQRINIGTNKNKKTNVKLASVKLASEFELEMKEEKMMDEKMMDEIEAEMMKDDQYLISIDSRYIQEIENENQAIRAQLAYFQNLYCRDTNLPQTQ
jgi:hypothetical protein